MKLDDKILILSNTHEFAFSYHKDNLPIEREITLTLNVKSSMFSINVKSSMVSTSLVLPHDLCHCNCPDVITEPLILSPCSEADPGFVVRGA